MATREEITKFSIEIEQIVKEKQVSYMDAVVIYCDETGFEVEIAAKLVSNAIRSKIRVEAEDLNFLPKSNTGKLPL